MPSRIIAFLMDPLEACHAEKDNSMYLMHVAQEMGHKIYHFTPQQLSLTHEYVLARAKPVTVNYETDPIYKVGEEEVINLRDVDIVMMRQDPPFNMEYITTTYMLEPLSKYTLVVNNPLSVRGAPEKIFPMAFKDYVPATLVTEDEQMAKQFVASHDKVIIKPLYMFGGTDVHLLENVKDLKKHWQRLLDDYKAPVVLQKFIPEVSEGDKRILFIDGEVQGAFLRVPQEGSVRANLASGGELKPTELDHRDIQICNIISPVLKEFGLYICGIDVIGGYITEINITSPMGFKQIDELYNLNTAQKLWDVLESKLKD